MQTHHSHGTSVALIVMSQKGRRLACDGIVIGTGHNGGPNVEIRSPEFTNAPQIELIEELIETSSSGLAYRGEIAGAILIPDFLWISPESNAPRIGTEQEHSRATHEEDAVPQNLIDAALQLPRSAICPLFRNVRQSVEQFASGVFIQIGAARFLLSAAHATDEKDILVPGRQGLVELAGHFAFTTMPSSGIRSQDTYDIAFVRLDEELVPDLHPKFAYLDAPHCDPMDQSSIGAPYSVIGIPSRRSETKGNISETSLLTLTGEGVPESQYTTLGLRPKHHIILRFRRKKAIDSKTGYRTIPCHPEGMSGGGIFAWAKDVTNLAKFEQPKLVGIVHEFHESTNLFVGTRLSCFLRSIKEKHPDLPIYRPTSK